MKFQLGDYVRSTYEDGYGRTGLIVDLEGYLNYSEEWCYLVAWDNMIPSTIHPKYLHKLTKLEQALL